MDYKVLLGYAASLLAIAGYVPYIKDTLARKTKPHAFSWFIWGLITGTAFVIQLIAGGGAGAWVTGVSAVITFFISFLGFVYGEHKFIFFDWVLLVGAVMGIILWQTTKNPLYAIIILSLTDAVGYIPTIRKAYQKPLEETLSVYVVGTLKLIIGFFAFSIFTITIWLYPVTLVVMNIILVSVCLVRRKN